MAERSGLIPVPDFRAVAREVDGKVVGAFGYDHHNRDWCFMHICLEPRGMNRRLLRMAFEVPFKQWGYEYVYAGIQETNKKCLKLAASLGFVEFDILPRVYPTERLRFLVMHKSDCRWLNLHLEHG
jgi:RimJ/RimL family protein N-acetyltransferase